jgi:hypothetical protein
MLIEEELMRGIEQYGPWSIQEFVARSGDMMDVLTYLRAERSLEMFKITSFVTVDSVNFERRTGLPSPERSEEKANTWTNKSDCVAPTDFKILLEEG